MVLLTLQRSEKQVIVIVTVSNIILILVTYTCNERVHIIGIKHGFSCINVCQVPRKVLKTEAKGRGFQQLPRDLANVNALENNV